MVTIQEKRRRGGRCKLCKKLADVGWERGEYPPRSMILEVERCKLCNPYMHKIERTGFMSSDDLSEMRRGGKPSKHRWVLLFSDQ